MEWNHAWVTDLVLAVELLDYELTVAKNADAIAARILPRTDQCLQNVGQSLDERAILGFIVGHAVAKLAALDTESVVAGPYLITAVATAGIALRNLR